MTNPVRVELSADRTWPSEESAPLGPWVLRATQGYSNRANSVRTVFADRSGSEEFSWPELIGGAEAFYRQRRLPVIFHISPVTVPNYLDQILAERGYAVEKSSQVWAADLIETRDATERSNVSGQIVQRSDPEIQWLKCAAEQGIADAKTREQIYRRIPGPRVFASIVEGNQTVSRALGVVKSGLSWLYSMATEEAAQRRGYATRLLNSLAHWAIANGGKEFWLQVSADNRAAHELYGRAAFTKRYDYHYRVLR